MGAMPVALPPMNALSGPLLNPNTVAISSGGRGSRRGRGRGGSSGSRRNDYNVQRHAPQQQQHQQLEGSPAPQSTGGQHQSQEQQSIESQQMMSAAYAGHPQFSAAHAPQFPYGYPAYFSPQQHLIHPGQNAAAQQAAGAPVYLTAMPVYNGPHMYNYGYFLPPVMNPGEFQYYPAEEVLGAPGVDERQAAGDPASMMWHQPHMYADEYGMNAGEMHSIGTDDMNHNASSIGSAAETPTSMLSPNYTPIYDQQLHEMQQQMGVMQIYEDPQMGPMQVMHPQASVSQVCNT